MSKDSAAFEIDNAPPSIAASLEETCEIPLPAAALGRVVVLRATDLLGNLAAARVDVP
jgi:hypothetical protein